MAIDLKKNRDSLLKAYNDITNDKNDTDWAVFGYEGQTSTLKVVETGDGGLDEMKDDFNSGKIMYGYCRVTDPNTGLFKYVLINWQGEGAPDQFRLKYSTHLRDVQAFFRSIHITINARTDDDVDTDLITTKVAKSSGSNYSFHKEKPRPVEAPTPVGSNYQRTFAQKDINNKSRDKFWAGTEKDETARVEEDKKKAKIEAERLDNERKEREVKEAKAREQAISEKMRKVSEHKRNEQLANATNKDDEKRKWEEEQKDISHADEQRRQRGEMLRKERAAEAKSVVGGKTSGTRSMFEDKSRQVVGSSNTGPPPPRKLKSSFLENQTQQEEPARKLPIVLPKGGPLKPPRSNPEPEPESEPYEPESEPYEPEPEVNEPETVVHEQNEDELQPVRTSANIAPSDLPKTRNLLQESLPKRQDSDEEEEEGWDEEPSEPRSPSPPQTQQTQQAPPPAVEEEEEESYVDTTPTTPTTTTTSDTGLTATALYDYEAADETEITFDPGEMITNIEQIDDGWWLGTAANGHHGMFPANYVEINE